jgi:histidyl-tRNA synthetase
VGAEAIGSASPALDAEIIQVVVEVLSELGFKNVDVRLNSVGTETSRVRYRDVLLDAIEQLGEEIGEEARERYRRNPLRIFDAKEYSATLKRRLPLISEYLVDEDKDHFARVKELLATVDVPFTEDPYLVRGLDYYTRTVFEVYHGEQGAQSALCGGGRYDTLVAACGGPDTPAIGMSVGLERIVEALDPERRAKDAGPDYYVVCVGSGAEPRALQAARVLREFGNVEVDVSGRSQKTQLESASKKKARAAVVVDASGPEVTYHDLAARTEVKVALDALREQARPQDRKR